MNRYSGIKENYNVFILLMVLGIVMFHCYVLHLFAGNAIEYTPDSSSYMEVSKNLTPNEYRTIGYPFFIYVIKRIAGVQYEGSIFWVQLFLTVVIFFCVIREILKIKEIWVRIILIVLLAANPSLIAYSHLVMTETLFAFCILLAVMMVYRYQESRKSCVIQLSFLFLCIAVLIRPGLLSFGLLCMGVLFSHLIRKKNWQGLIIAVLIFSTTIAHESYRYYEKFGKVKISSIGDITLYRYWYSKTNAQIFHTPVDREMRTGDSILQSYPDKKFKHEFAKQQVKQVFMKYPVYALTAFLQNLISNTHTGNMYVNKSVFNVTRVFNMLSVFLLLLTDMILVFFYFFRKFKVDFILLLPLLLCNFLFFTSGISFWQGDRFVVVFVPVMLITISAFFQKEK